MTEPIEVSLARIEERTENVLGSLSLLSKRIAEDHDILIPLAQRFSDHCDDHRKRESLFQWKVGIMVVLASAAIGVIVKLV